MPTLLILLPYLLQGACYHGSRCLLPTWKDKSSTPEGIKRVSTSSRQLHDKVSRDSRQLHDRFTRISREVQEKITVILEEKWAIRTVETNFCVYCNHLIYILLTAKITPNGPFKTHTYINFRKAGWHRIYPFSAWLLYQKGEEENKHAPG